MALDPRTPVLVGVGQVTNRPDPSLSAAERPEPLDLMVRAITAAAEDCDDVAPGSISPAGRALLEATNSLRVIAGFGWHTTNPALLVAERLGIAPQASVLSATGGNSPQALAHDAAREIASGALDVVVVVGAECMYTRGLARRSVDHTALQWATQAPETTPAPRLFGEPDRMGTTETETAAGARLPIEIYPILENAIRASNGRTRETHANALGNLWSNFSEVAATNPYAWITEAATSDAISLPSEANRMVAEPYTKLMTANLPVDQGAAYIMCSVEAAERAGVSRDRWVFPLSGADGNDHWFISHRPSLSSSPAIRLAGERAFALGEVIADELAAIDLYSCFPAAVEIAATELGLPLGDPERPLTVTGGLTFMGGPGNNYVTHSIATMASRLRNQPGACGLVTGLGWFVTKHSVGLYASRPPRHMGRDGFRWESVQDAVDVLPQARVDASFTGEVVVESYTITYDRTGVGERAIICARTIDDTRVWASSTEPDTLSALCDIDPVGASGHIDDARLFTLR